MVLHRTIIRHLLKTPLSIADLQIATQVSLPTLNKAVRVLSEAQWIRVVGQAEANGGRPAMLYGVDDRTYLIVGLHLQLPGMRLLTTDLTGQVLDETELFHGVVPTTSESVGAVADYITKIRKNFPSRKILGIGIAAPGFIDLISGDIISIGRVPTWENFPICTRLQAALGVPVQIANDVDCMAFAEFQYSSEALEKNLAYIGFDEGVKASLFLKGELYKGSLGNVGLISEKLLRVDEAPDFKGSSSLLTLKGVNHVFETMVNELPAIAQRQYSHIIINENQRERFYSILENATNEMPVCNNISKNLIWVLSVAVANLIHIIQPDVIVIGGLLSAMPKPLYENLEIAIREYLPALINNKSILRQGVLASQNSAAIGAIHHFLQENLNETALDLI